MRERLVRTLALYLLAGPVIVSCAETGSFDGRRYFKEGVTEEQRVADEKVCEAFARAIVAERVKQGVTQFSPRDEANLAYWACMKEQGYRRL